MTENETIKMFEERLTLDTIESVPEYAEALRTAITSLKEIQMYHDGKLCLIPKDVYSRQCSELDTYKEIGTVEECRKAVGKQKAKKSDYEGDGYADGQMVYDTWICPNCGERYEVEYDNYDYCPKCGQKILKESEEE